jgi:processive 1,2-diacylglycerol beta-glucosyltransferase
MGVRSILVVTDSPHIPRARELFEHAGFGVRSAPVDEVSRVDAPKGRLQLMPWILKEYRLRRAYRIAGYLSQHTRKALPADLSGRLKRLQEADSVPSVDGDLLILSASYGGGHNQVAAALTEAFAELAPDITVKTIDFFELVSALCNRLTRFSYVQSVRYFPRAYGWFYQATSTIAPDSWLQRRLNRLGRTQLIELIEGLRPRAIICTYPTPAGVLSELRKEGKVTVPVFTVITDHAVHSQWIHAHVDGYFVSAPEVAEGLRERGLDAARLRVSGIPIRAQFHHPPAPRSTRDAYGLSGGVPAILVMAGAFAMLGGVSEVLEVLQNFPKKLQVVIMAGHDRRLVRRLRRMAASSQQSIRVEGFVQDVAGLMAAADALITKAGGITTAEALAMTLPMVIYRPIPGQEEANTRFLVTHQAALCAGDRTSLERHLAMLFTGGEALAHMRAAARRLARPQAALTVAHHILKKAVFSDGR